MSEFIDVPDAAVAEFIGRRRRRALLEDLADHQRLNGARGCELALEAIPYDCETRRRHPGAVVVVCRSHLVWFSGHLLEAVAS